METALSTKKQSLVHKVIIRNIVREKEEGRYIELEEKQSQTEEEKFCSIISCYKANDSA